MNTPNLPVEVVTLGAERVATEMRKHPVFDLSLGDERLREIAFELAVGVLEVATPALRDQGAAAERERQQDAVWRQAAAAVYAERERIATWLDATAAAVTETTVTSDSGAIIAVIAPFVAASLRSALTDTADLIRQTTAQEAHRD
jgi:hypothetical protein